MTQKPRFLDYPFWSPRLWYGMKFGHWLPLISANLIHIHVTRWPMAIAVTVVTLLNTFFSWIQSAIHGTSIRETKIAKPPVFILGHWRCGTTYLHELMILDDRFTFPTTFQCCAPCQTLVTEWFVTRYLNFLVPDKRPMDNMQLGWEKPQEDEFALLALGAPTPYLRLAFPNQPPPAMNWLNPEGVDASEVGQFKQKLHWFVQLLTYRDQKRVVLKSPPHTGRVELLRELFPGAKFIHLVRNPYDIFPSTRRLWQALDNVQAFQIPHHKELDEYIFRAFEIMYEGFHKHRDQLPEESIIDVRYEDLVANPVQTLKLIYEQLDLGDFDDVESKIAADVQRTKDYQTNRHQCDESTREHIRTRWSDYFERYGYPK